MSDSQDRQKLRKETPAGDGVRGSCGEEVHDFGDECGKDSVSPREAQIFAMETSRGSNVGATVLFQGSELHIKVCI